MMSRPSSSASLPAFGRGPNDSSYSLLSRRGSEVGSRFIQVDDSGVYLSSVVVTVLVSGVVTIGILLFTLVVTLSVMLGSCQREPFSLKSVTALDTCRSIRLNEELNNIQGWVPSKACESNVASYVTSGQYYVDFAVSVDAARGYLKTLSANADGLDVVVLDIDETALSNMPYYIEHHFGAEDFNETVWDSWVGEIRATPLSAMLKLYKELRASNWSIIFITGRPESQRNITDANLRLAGYEDWELLQLRSQEETGLTANKYKSARRVLLEKQGYRIRGCLGDQWSDCSGPAAGLRSFKLPNPMYYIF